MSVPGAVQDPERLHTADITLDSGGLALPAYLARPENTASPHPGLIVVHEAFGVTEHIRDVTRRFANAGFDAIAPDLYARSGGAPDPAGGIEAIRPAMARIVDADAIRDLDAAAAHLRSLDGSNGHAGCTGFCMGGRYTLLYACSSDGVDAAVPCWGGYIERAGPDEETTANRPTPPAQLAEQLHCPILLVGGAEDQNPSPEMLTRLAERMRAAGKDVRLEIFENAGHAFFHDGRPGYRPEAAEKLWPMLLEFFASHLH